VVDWKDVEGYIEEDDVILIGPGMTRQEPSSVIPAKAGIYLNRFRLIGRNDNENRMTIKTAAKNDNTAFIVNYLLKKYPDKKWVIDGGALQEVDLGLISKSCILTPHRKEFLNLFNKSSRGQFIGRGDLVLNSDCRVANAPRNDEEGADASRCAGLSKYLNNCTILLKGQTDIVCQGKKCTEIKGGNAGMTKGGTGDVLAGLAAALFTKNDSWTSATMASYINKKAGESLHKRVGPYFNAEDLVKEVPLTIYGIIREIEDSGVVVGDE
jgi:NAD(P)H-hydrate epimerase